MDRCRTSRSRLPPAIDFDFGKNRLKFSSESYPEDVTEFYNPVCSALDAYLAALGPGSCRFDFELIYVNSSGAKAVMMLMDKLDAAAAKGAAVDVYWFYDPRLRIRRLYPALEPEGWRPSRRT